MFHKLVVALRWLGVRLLVAVAVWAVVYTAMNYHLTRERDRAMAWFSANGIATYPEQFTRPEVAAKDDAGPFWRAAGELAQASDLYEELCGSIPGAGTVQNVTLKNGDLIIEIGRDEGDIERPLTADELAALKKILDAREPVFELLHQAASRAKYDSPINYSQGIGTLLPYLGPAMRLARLPALAAEVSVHEGRIDRAIDYWRSLKALERWSADEPTLITSLVTATLDKMLCESVQKGLRARPFSENDLKQVAAILEPHRGYREQLRLGMGNELPALNVYVRDLLDGRFDMREFNVDGTGKAAGLARLALLADQTIALRYYRQLHEQLRTDFLPGQLPTLNRDALPWYAWTTRTLTPALGGAVKEFCKSEARRRVTAWGVALRRQKLAAGSYPERLADLKSEFTRGLGEPVDPFTGTPLIYRRQGPGFIVYSVGPDTKDDGGRYDRESKVVADDIAVEFSD